MIYFKVRNNLVLSLLFVLTYTFHIEAQQSNTMYFMKGIPQSHMYNPATQPIPIVFVGLPGISDVRGTATHNSFNLNDLVYHSELLDSTVFALHPTAGNTNQLLSNFGRKNYISLEAYASIISCGFKASEFYFTFNYGIKSTARMLYPTDYMRLILEGDIKGKDFDFDDFRVDLNAFQEFAFGASYNIDPTFTVGGKAKLLFGLANMSQKNTNIGLTTSPFSWPTTVQFINNISIPFLNLEFIDERIDSIWFQEDLGASDYFGNAFRNFGLGFDLGAHYTIDDLTLSASVIDLGYIRWKNNLYNINIDGNYDIRGIQADSLFSPDENSEYDPFEALIDSIDKNIIVQKNSNSLYTTALPAKIYLGASYRVHPNIQFGILSRSEFFKKKYYQQLTLSTTLFPDKVMSPTISYTMMNKSYGNLGLGFSLRLYYLHFYFVSDNIPLIYAREVNNGYPLPHKAKTINLHAGLNLVFGANKMKKLLNDKPIIE